MCEQMVTPSGHRLWGDHGDALRFAEARAVLYGTRQRVTGELVLGRWFWRACKAQARVPEPCS